MSAAAGGDHDHLGSAPHVMHVGLYSELFDHVDVSGTRTTALLHTRAAADLSQESRERVAEVAAVDVPHRLNNNDYDDYYPRLLAAAEGLAERWGPPRAVVGLYEHTVVPAARLREHFGLPGLGLDTAVSCRDKVVMKQRVAAHGVPVPRTLDLAGAGPEAVASWVAGGGARWVLKPKSEGGAIGVRVLSSPQECVDVAAGLGAERDRWEIEEFVEGDIHHLDGVVRDGQLRFSALSRYVGTCYDCAVHREPLGSVTVDSEDLRRSADETAAAVLAALGIQDAVIHLELFLRDGAWVFLEVACRHGGVGVVETIDRAFGVDLIAESYRADVMAPSPIPLDPAAARRRVDGHGSSGWLIVPMQVTGEHRVTAVRGPGEQPAVSRQVLPEVGELVDDTFRPFATLGSFWLRGEDDAEVTAAVHQVVDRFEVDLTPVPPNADVLHEDEPMTTEGQQ